MTQTGLEQVVLELLVLGHLVLEGKGLEDRALKWVWSRVLELPGLEHMFLEPVAVEPGSVPLLLLCFTLCCEVFSDTFLMNRRTFLLLLKGGLNETGLRT
ncbi:hypothetical protein XENOCAPTIV_023742 [Xenoophorus captivus]|uniref:Uncharacterized protein n=1 Tax=Xenoophorus captivus TaxID=1517983 RepID=A0ABV0R1T9_9TELE